MSAHPAPPDAATAYVPPRWRPETVRRYVLGCDLGQLADATALAVIERETVWSPTAATVERRPRRPVYNVRHLERLPLGVTYPAQAAHVARLLATPPLAGNTELAVDSTGVGIPVLDLLRHAGLRPVGITITAGERVTREGGDYRVPKLELVSRVQALLHAGELRIARAMPEATALTDELRDFRVTFNAVGYASFGARTGRHDDLVLAVAIAVWLASRATGRQVVRLHGI
jgi:hypothetical protein